MNEEIRNFKKEDVDDYIFRLEEQVGVSQR